MTAEAAWKVAMEAATEIVAQDYVCDAIRSLPMPPDFRAAVEAEMGEVVEMLQSCVKAMGSAEAFIGSRAKMEKDNRADYAWLLRSACALLSRMEGKR